MLVLAVRFCVRVISVVFCGGACLEHAMAQAAAAAGFQDSAAA